MRQFALLQQMIVKYRDSEQPLSMQEARDKVSNGRRPYLSGQTILD